MYKFDGKRYVGTDSKQSGDVFCFDRDEYPDENFSYLYDLKLQIKLPTERYQTREEADKAAFEHSNSEIFHEIVLGEDFWLYKKYW
jgi:hypothetical protein